MLDTCISSFFMREHPATVNSRLAAEFERGNRIEISAITYAEMRCGHIGKKALLNRKVLVNVFVRRLSAVIPRGLTCGRCDG